MSSRGAVGGSANEAGSRYRADVGALLATYLLLHQDVQLGDESVGDVGETIRAESDDAVDDLALRMTNGRQVFVQVKLKVGLDSSPPLARTLDQFAGAFRADPGSNDALVLIAKQVSSTLLPLGTLLSRERHAEYGNPTTRELRAKDHVATMLRDRGVLGRDLQALLRRIYVVQIENPRALTVARLGGTIVEANHAPNAATALSSEIQKLARLRAGHDALGLIEAIVRGGVPLTGSAAAARSVREGQQLHAYRERCIRRGRSLALLGAPRGLANIPFAEADGRVAVLVPPTTGSEQDRETTLGLALRRRGRVVLVGTGGAGKSTALRSLVSDLAANPDGPIPIIVHARDLKSRAPDFDEAVLSSVTRNLSNLDERAALASAVRQRLAAGDCVIAIDGFDEVHTGRESLARQFASWLEDQPASTEVVLATRPIALAHSDHLGWPILELKKPADCKTTSDAIIDAAATARKAPATWSSSRKAWIRSALKRDPALGVTPLTVVLLAVVSISTENENELPRSRALILMRTLTDVLHRWEVEARREGDVRLGSLSPQQGQTALVQGLWELADRALRDSDPLHDLVSQLGQSLIEGFGLGSLDAEATAREALGFWYETGLFIAEDELVRTTLRPLAEVASAWQRTTRKDLAWIAPLRADPSQWPVLSLSAGLDVRVVSHWVQAIATDGSIDELVAFVDAYQDGVRVPGAELDALIDGPVLEWLADPAHAERVAEAVLALPLTAQQRIRVRPHLCTHLAEDRRTIVEAATSLAFCESDERAVARLRAVFTMEGPSSPGRWGGGIFHVPERDAFYQRTLVAASLQLAAVSRQDAEQVVARFEGKATRTIKWELPRVLTEAGHQDLARRMQTTLREAEERSRLPQSMVALFEEYDAANGVLLRTVAGFGFPRELGALEQRRMDELADLWATARVNWIMPRWILDRSYELATFLDVALTLGDFDRELCVAQAGVMLRELTRDQRAELLLFDSGEERELRHWSAVDDVPSTVRQLTNVLGLVPRDVAIVIVDALGHCPDAEVVRAALTERLPRLKGWTRLYCAETILAFSLDVAKMLVSWSRDADPILRTAAATLAGSVVEGAPSDETLLSHLLRDRDRGVQTAAAESLQLAIHGETVSLDDQLRSCLCALVEESPHGYLCIDCGHVVEPGDTDCGDCKTSGPDARQPARDILGLTSRKTPFQKAPRPPRIRATGD